MAVVPPLSPPPIFPRPSSMSPVTLSALLGGRLLNEKTDGEEARGGERDARADKVTEDMDFGRGNLGGGGRGGTTAINGTRVNSLKYRPESSVQVAAPQGLEQHHLIMSKLSGHGDRT